MLRQGAGDHEYAGLLGALHRGRDLGIAFLAGREAALDGEHPLRMGEIPGFAAFSLSQSGNHQLSTHCAVAEQRPLLDYVLQEVVHDISLSGDLSLCARA